MSGPAASRWWRSERGVALIMVLWIFMVLTVIVAEFSRGMRDDAVATHNLAEETQARAVASAGINLAIYRTLRMREQQTDELPDEDDPDAWQPDGRWHDGSYWGGRFSVRMIDEGGKIGINRADETLLRRVFANLGLGIDDQQAIVDAILDWTDPDDLHRAHGAEADYYRTLPEPYLPKNGRFDSVDELLQVRGITRELFFGIPPEGLGRDDVPPIALKDVFSVFNRTGNINVRYAPDVVLRALMGGEEEAVEEIVASRVADPGSALTLLRARVGDSLLARRLVDTPARTVAIDAKAVMQEGQVQARVGSVVEVNEDADGFRVVRWLDRLPIL